MKVLVWHHFEGETWVKEEFKLSPLLFLIIIDYAMRKTNERSDLHAKTQFEPIQTKIKKRLLRWLGHT